MIPAMPDKERKAIAKGHQADAYSQAPILQFPQVANHNAQDENSC